MKTDAQLQHDVMRELARNPAIRAAAQIGVGVRDGVVTLTGEVDDHAGKWNVEQTALRVPGVMALALGLEVGRAENGRRTDADIAQSAKNALIWTSSLPADAVQVTVENGLLTLSGQVRRESQRQDAMQAVHPLPGVTGVSNQIAVAPAPAAAGKPAGEATADVAVAALAGDAASKSR